jgi:uncharacterized protein YjlB
MKTLVLTVVALAFAAPALAQPLEVPRLSPNAKITQTVGLTDITVEYSSPGVKGRSVWGAVVPYGEVWRAGANAATKLTFSKDVTFGGTALPAGSYAFFVIPAQTGNWTVIVNKDFAQSGAFSYKKELDVLRLDVTPEAIPLRERLAYLVTDFDNQQATLALEWEKVRIAVPIKLGTDAQVAASLKGYEDGAWMPYNQAARYQFEQKKDFDAGLALVEKSLRIKEDWFNLWTKAQLLAAKGKFKDALPLAQKAQQLGEKAPRFFAADEVKKALAEWKTKK